MSDIQYLCSQPQGSSVGQHFSSVAVQGWETDASRGLNLPNMHVHTQSGQQMLALASLSFWDQNSYHQKKHKIVLLFSL